MDSSFIPSAACPPFLCIDLPLESSTPFSFSKSSLKKSK
uniref:Uncharacterized protein n=1 Tax=Anguilla anguilla TaxID=7936 RepID=A0A0E9SNV4_ANGAN